MEDQRSLLLENTMQGTQTWGIRVYSDGYLEVLSDHFLCFDGNEVITIQQPLKWRWQATLAQDDLLILTKMIHSSGILDLPVLMESDTPETNPLRTAWRLMVDGKEKTIQTIGSQAANHPVFNKLTQALQEAKVRAMQPLGTKRSRKSRSRLPPA
ncbi:MAG TPA: hypothetical protein VIO61_03730 [Anaerolineaceae bacterium]